jgi:hypothetical protein
MNHEEKKFGNTPELMEEFCFVSHNMPSAEKDDDNDDH